MLEIQIYDTDFADFTDKNKLPKIKFYLLNC